MKTTKDKILIAATVVASVAVMVILGALLFTDKPASVPAPLKLEEPKERVVYRDVERFVEVEKRIGCELIEGRLQDMGELITGEYIYTGLLSFSKDKEVFHFKIPLSETGFIVSYTSRVSAGIDMTALKVSEDADTGVVTISVPKPTVYSTDIDYNSFKLHSEKNGVGNHLTVNEVNESFKEYERQAEESAIEVGLLDSAEKNARLIIKNFADSLIAGDGRVVRIVFI